MLVEGRNREGVVSYSVEGGEDGLRRGKSKEKEEAGIAWRKWRSGRNSSVSRSVRAVQSRPGRYGQ